MDATDRKNAWMNLEDEFWEIEKRWQWLYRKVKMHLQETTNQEQGQYQKVEETEEKIPESKPTTATISLEEKIQQLQSWMPNSEFFSAFCQYCEDMYEAVLETTKTMDTIKKLLWTTWENDTICESFYDAIQFSQQLLENLSSSWSIAFSLFRVKDLDLLYRAEKLVHHAANAHQMSVKFILSCWQTYLAAHCHTWIARLNHARTRMKDSGHTVGQMFSRGLVSSHALTVAIARGLQPLTAYKIMSTHLLETKSELGLMKDSSEKTPLFRKEDAADEVEDSLTSTTSASEIDVSTESVPQPCGAEGPSKNALKEFSFCPNKNAKPPTSDAEVDKKKLFVKAKCWDVKGAKHPPTRTNSGLRAFRCDIDGFYNPGNQCNAAISDSQCDQIPGIPSPSFLAKAFRPTELEGKRQRNKKMDDSESLCSKCKCCRDGKRHRPESFATSDRTSLTSGSSDKDLTSRSNEVTVTSNTRPEFKLQEWEALLVDVVDLNKEWKTLSSNLSADSTLGNKFNADIILKNEQDTTGTESQVEEAEEFPNQENDDDQNINDTAFGTVFDDLIESMRKALTLSSQEIKRHIKTWTEREKRHELQVHYKGYDPNEAILQAKSFLFQLMESFFAMLLLTAADSKRRMLCYASLLPESIAESRKFAYSLILSREISSSNTRIHQENEKTPKTVHRPQTHLPLLCSTPQVVNPHPLCHHLAMALSRAHLLSSKFIALISKTGREEIKEIEA